MRHTIAVEVKSHTQVIRPYDIVQISDRREVLGSQTAVERIETLQSMIFISQVRLHKSHVWRQVLKQRAGKRLGQHGDAHVGILLCQRIDHRHRHGDIT